MSRVNKMSTTIEVKHIESGETLTTGNLTDDQASSQLIIVSNEYGDAYKCTISTDPTIEDGN